MLVRVSVIVITHNGKRYLKECFESLAKQIYKDFDAYLLDNGSTDGSSEFVREKFPWVKIIRFEKNYGFAEGYNRSIRMVNTEYVALLNDDTKVDRKWLEELVKAIESDISIFAVGSKILFHDSPDVINYADGKFTLMGACLPASFGEKDSPKFNKLKYVGAVCGAAVLFRRKIFEEIGGFDGDYFAYHEDVDLCWRAWLKGYRCVYTPKSVVLHRYGGTWGPRWGRQVNPLKLYLVTRNRLANIIKNFEAKNIPIALLCSLLFDFVNIMTNLSSREMARASFNVLKANWDFLKGIKRDLEKRRKIQSNRVLKDKDLQNLGLFASLTESFREFVRIKRFEELRDKNEQ